MTRFLIDANLPYKFSVWHGGSFEHVFDHDDTGSDMEIWRYAQDNDLTIVTKDADFCSFPSSVLPPERQSRSLQVKGSQAGAWEPAKKPAVSIRLGFQDIATGVDFQFKFLVTFFNFDFKVRHCAVG